MKQFVRLLVFIGMIISSHGLQAKQKRHYGNSKVSPRDYLFGERTADKDDIFNQKIIEQDVDLGIGSDCGNLDIRNTLKASLGNILKSDYFGSIGKDIVGSAPMLLTCYMSPTWCAILKNSRLQANFLAQTRLNQCKVIDSYVDSRVSDFYDERARCVKNALVKHGGNMDAATDECGKNVYSFDLANWSGSKYGKKSKKNELLESSARWAGFNNPETRSTIDFLKSVVGDTVVSKGNISVNYGRSGSHRSSPRAHLIYLASSIAKKLEALVLKADLAGGGPLYAVISDKDLSGLTENSSARYIDRQTITSLSLMSYKRRAAAMKRLSSALAMTVFTKQAHKGLDILTAAAQNPHLPELRKLELERKRRQFKDSVDLAMKLNREQDEPVNQVLYQINTEGSSLRDYHTNIGLVEDAADYGANTVRSALMDCADDIFCDASVPGRL